MWTYTRDYRLLVTCIALVVPCATTFAQSSDGADVTAALVCSYPTIEEVPGVAEARETERSGEFAATFDHYDQALDIVRSQCGESHDLVPTLLSNRAMIAIELGQFEAAESGLTLAESIARAREPVDAIVLARILYTRGSFRMRVDQFAGAEEDLLQTLAILNANPDVPADYAIRTRSTLAGVYYMMGQPAKALEEFRPVIETYRENQTFPEYANALGNLGELYRVLGDMDNAARYFQESIDAYDAGGGPGHIGSALPINNLALTHFFRGNYERAEALFERALEIRRNNFGEVHPEVSDTLLNLGGVASATGRYAEANALFESALAIQRQIYDGDHESIADSLGNIGSVLTALASYPEAIEILEQSVGIRQRLHGDNFYGNSGDLSNLSVAYRNAGRYDEAERAASKSIELLQQGYGSDYLSTYGMYIELARVYSETGRAGQALTTLQEGLALATKALGDHHPDVARLHANIGRLQMENGDYLRAAESLNSAYTSLAGLAGRPDASAEVFSILGDYERSRGDDLLAIYFGKRAVNDLQSLRSGAVDLDTALQRRYLASIEQVYRDLANRLIDAGRLTEAQQVLAMLREEEYSDFTRLRAASESAAQTRATYTVGERALRDRYGEINGELAAVGEELSALREQRQALAAAGRSLNDEDAARLESLQARQREIREDFANNLSELRNYFAEAGGERAIEFGQRDLDSLQALQSVIRRIEQPGSERVVLLTYLMTDTQLRILLTSSNSLLHRDVDVSPTAINRLVFEHRQAVQDVTADPRQVGGELYKLLVAPVQDDLDVIDADVLLTSLDGALRYLPMAALHDGDGYLAERYALSVFTAAARLNLEPTPSDVWTAAGMGVTEPGDEFLSLPSVGAELDMIIREAGRAADSSAAGVGDSTGVLDGRTWLNEAFTAGALADALLSGFDVVHLASHFVFKPGTERDSFLVLGDGNRLTLGEFVTDEYAFDDIDLLTLSACDTALGGDTATGKEIEGFGALAQNKGAGAVLATLWPVADVTTAELMAKFYEYRQLRSMTKAQALREVQRSFIAGDENVVARIRSTRGGARGSGLDVDVSHPFYWAPFVLMGNWQ